MTRHEFLAVLKRKYPTAASATAAKLELAQAMRVRDANPDSPAALRDAAAQLRRDNPGDAYFDDLADTFELSAAL